MRIITRPIRESDIILAVLPEREDRTSLKKIVAGCNWKLHWARSFEQARAYLRSGLVGVVISESRLEDGFGWREVLHETHSCPVPPLLIVADRLADEALWAEVLNIGGYDLLLKPFESREVLHVLGGAWRCLHKVRAAAAGAIEQPRAS